MIQVKATASGIRSFPISLTNWHHFCSNPMPCFFVVVEFSKSDHSIVESVYLVEVAGEIMTGALRTLSKRKGLDPKTTGKRVRHLKLKESQKIERPHHSNLFKAIRSSIGPDIFSYQHQKANHFKEAGVEFFSSRVWLSPKGDQKGKAVAQVVSDFCVGKRDTLEYDKIESFVKRFGEIREHPALSFGEPGVIRADHSSTSIQASIEVSTEKTPVIAKMNVTYSETLTLPPSHLEYQIWIRSELFDLSIFPNNPERRLMHLEPKNLSATLSLPDLYALVKYIYVSQLAEMTGKDLVFKILVEKKEIHNFKMVVTGMWSDEYELAFNYMRSVYNLAIRNGIEESLETNFFEIFDDQSAVRGYQAIHSSLIIGEELRIDTPFIDAQFSEICVPTIFQCRVGGFSFATFLVIIASRKRGDPEVGLVSSEWIITDRHIFQEKYYHDDNERQKTDLAVIYRDMFRSIGGESPKLIVVPDPFHEFIGPEMLNES